MSRALSGSVVLSVILGMFFVLMSGCGGDEGGSPFFGGCVPGLGECRDSNLCIQGSCESPLGRRFRMTVKEGTFRQSAKYYVTVSYRGEQQVGKTMMTHHTPEPVWEESFMLDLQYVSDWWRFEVKSEGFWSDSLVLACDLEFTPRNFETHEIFDCYGSSERDQLVIELEPLW